MTIFAHLLEAEFLPAIIFFLSIAVWFSSLVLLGYSLGCSVSDRVIVNSIQYSVAFALVKFVCSGLIGAGLFAPILSVVDRGAADKGFFDKAAIAINDEAEVFERGFILFLPGENFCSLCTCLVRP
jgi:hypothetical protein